MNRLVVSPDHIRQLASEVNRGAANLNDIVRGLTTAFHSSSGYWEGNTQRQFTDAYQEWDTSWKQMHASLENMQKLINDWVARVEELDRSVNRG